MSALLIQAPDSKRWHIGLRQGNSCYLPVCTAYRLDYYSQWATDAGARSVGWRTPHGICSNCAREVKSAVRLIAPEERADGL